MSSAVKVPRDWACNALVEFLERYICYRRDDYAIQLKSGKYARMGQPLKRDDIIAHVRGEITIGVYQSKYPEELCRWVVYDIDHDDNCPEKSEIQKYLLKSVLIHNKVPFYVEDSGSLNSMHMWVFLSSPTPLHLAYNWARAMVVRGSCSERSYDLSDGKYMFSGEIFPKQAALNSEKPYGNLVKVPFGIHQVTDRRTHFYDSSRGKPDAYMQNVETVDLSHWIPVDLPANERSKGSKVIKEGLDKSDSNVLVEGKPELYRFSQNVRPCIQKMLQTGTQLEHYDGHMLRIAIASELLKCGLTPEQVVDVFQPQGDFNYNKSLEQVLSVRGYNRPTCQRIQWHCKRIEKESGFKIGDVCSSCIFSHQEMNHAGRI